MNKIEIKRLDNTLMIYLNESSNFLNILDELNEHLEIIKERNNNVFDVIINLGYLKLDSHNLYELINNLLKDERFVIKEIINKNIDVKLIKTYEGIIRAGECKTFKEKTLINGDINPSAQIISYDDLYVVGKIKGKIILKRRDSIIYASGYQNANITIFNKNINDFSCLNVKKLDYEFVSKGE